MRLKLDENLSGRLRSVLAAAGHDLDTVLDEGLGGAADSVVAEAAQRECWMLLTIDLDFATSPASRRGVTQE